MIKDAAVIRKQLSLLRKGVSDPVSQELYFVDTIQTVKGVPRRITADDAFEMRFALEFYGVYLANRGVVAVCDADPGGWNKLYSGWYCLAWAFRTALHQTESQGERLSDLSETIAFAPHVLATSIALGHRTLAATAAKLLVAATGRVLAVGKKNHVTPFESFLIFLLAQALNQGFVIEKSCQPLLKAYRAVIDGWADAGGFADRLAGICEYHCQRMTDRGGMEEFVGGPFNLFPAEILAVLALLQNKFGKTPPLPTHPLLELPTMSLPARFRLELDPSIKQGIQKLKAHLKLTDEAVVS